jgi:anti-sigma factor RsiW
MTCGQVRQLLSAYLDRELGLPESLAVDEHLRGCEACASQFDSLRALQRSTGPELAFAVPEGLERRVRAALRREVAAPPRRFVALSMLTAAAALVAIAFGLVPALRPRAEREDQLRAEVVSAHVRSLMVDHAVDVASSDQHSVKPWFEGKLDFSPPVTDLAAQGFSLVGGRLDYIARRPVAALVYKRRQHLVNVFVWGEAGSPRSTQAFADSGLNVATWRRKGFAFWAVSTANADDLEALARLIPEP